LTASSIFVPTVKKGFLKFWWDEKFSLLKKASVKSDKLWKASGKPRNGPIFTNRQSCRLLYRKHLKTTCYTNDLHDALMQKNSNLFWQCWRSKFDYKSLCAQVDGCVDTYTVACKFRDHFAKAYTCSDADRAEQLV